MPNDLERAFAALSDDTDRQARLTPATDLRKRGDRQTLTRSVTAVAAAVVLVAGALLGSRLALTDNALPPLPPAESIAATTAAPPPSVSTSDPSPPPASGSTTGAVDPGSTTPTIPASIPARAFLVRSEVNAGSLKRLKTPVAPPELCTDAEDFGSEKRIGVRGTVEIQVAAGDIPADLYEDGKDPETDYFPAATITETVTVYRGDGAGDFLDEFRAAVKACPRGWRGNSDVTYRSRGSLGLGDESLLVDASNKANSDGGLPDDPTVHWYLGAVRIGDAVVLVRMAGYQAETVERAKAEDVVGKAADRLTGWRP
jgi:hypothetical protein